jgi:hypothetical protein
VSDDGGFVTGDDGTVYKLSARFLVSGETVEDWEFLREVIDGLLDPWRGLR